MWQRIIPEILDDGLFKNRYRRLEFDQKYDIPLDDVDVVFYDSEVSNWCISVLSCKMSQILLTCYFCNCYLT